MKNNKYTRRELMRMGLWAGGGALALEQLTGLPLLGDFLARNVFSPGAMHLDAYKNMQMLLGNTSRALGMQQALAQAAATDSEPWSVVSIKVVNHIHIPLLFRINDGYFDPTSRGGGATAYLKAKGANQLSDKSRYAALKFNKWFADILHNGTSDGMPRTVTNLLGVAGGDVGDFPAEVALQVGMHMNQPNTGQNHSLKGFKLRENVGDLLYYLSDKNLLESPLGTTCFMMGDVYDKAEGSRDRNAVLGNTGENPIIDSKSVASYVSIIEQSLSKSYSDVNAVNSNLTYQFDKLAVSDPKLRRDILNSRQEMLAKIQTLMDAKSLETRAQALDLTVGNIQGDTGGTSSFLAQCLYVSRSLEIPGRPLRSFSLFLNTTDLDGSDLDKGRPGAGPSIPAMCYVEGMRQLAMGLNLLAQSIKRGRKLLVMVTSEGGRRSDMLDGAVSAGIFMGPKTKFSDALYGNAKLMGDAAASVAALGAFTVGAGQGWDAGLVAEDGSALSGMPVNTGDFQMGVVEFLESELKVKSTRTGLGNYVKLKRT